MRPAAHVLPRGGAAGHGLPPVAYWVGDGLKETSAASWDEIDLISREVAVIVVVKDEILADAAFDIWNEIRDPIATAFAQRLDAAIFAGQDKPADWPEALIPAAIAAGNVVDGGATPAQGGLFADVAEVMDMVEAGGFETTAFAADRALKGRLRRQRTASGDLLSDEITTDRLWDVGVTYAVAGSLGDDALLVGGDYSTAVIGVRQDMRIEMFREGIISDDTGKVVRNLLQEDATAMRVTGRWSYALAQPATLQSEAGDGGFPFAVLRAGDGSRARRAQPEAKTTAAKK